MYCHKCGLKAREHSLYCRQCGVKLVGDAEESGQEPELSSPPQSDVPIEEVTGPLDAKGAYYRRLGEILVEKGFRLDVGDVEKGDAGKSMPGWAIGLMTAGIAAEVGPFSDLAAPLIRSVFSLAAVGGEELRDEIRDAESMFAIVAAKYYHAQLTVFGIAEADALEISEAEARADALGDALAKTFETRGSWKRWLRNHYRNQVGAYCLYVFFDEERGNHMAPLILEKCLKMKRRVSLIAMSYVFQVTPIVANVPAKELVHKKGLQGFTFSHGWEAVSKEMLVKAFG